MRWARFFKVAIWLIAIVVTLQLLDYDWNVFNFMRRMPASSPLTHFGTSQSKFSIPKDRRTNVTSVKLNDTPFSVPFDLDLRVIVITYDRADSVERLLNSLNEADYLGDKVGIDVWIDRSKTGVVHEETFSRASRFKFKHGILNVHKQSKHAGIYGQWMKTWNPSPQSKEIAVILEDDLTVSKYFYKWLKNVHTKYDSLSYINGYALQGYSMKHGGAAGQLRAPDENIVFMYPILGTWGFSPSRENWISYVKWYDQKSELPNFQPTVAGILPTLWYNSFIKKGKTGGMWSMWHIYHAWKFQERSIYPNLPGKCGLTINWKEAGLHYAKSQTVTKNTDPILTVWDKKFENLPDVPVHLNVNGVVCPRDQYI
ncbi:uncharacterized protein LOC132545346 [Ylistrum balloti]|uniref:uncharacterized protein LOC132545346 n=1 Tax=Ylistrum balloti TaxID=509963 RepID=UPI002905969A|nr:uncharacterized protein LOC132545346 [Ylistrum balloti]